jgi:hypothetical protein
MSVTRIKAQVMPIAIFLIILLILNIIFLITWRIVAKTTEEIFDFVSNGTVLGSTTPPLS